jgi:hypothetical protein
MFSTAKRSFRRATLALAPFAVGAFLLSSPAGAACAKRKVTTSFTGDFLMTGAHLSFWGSSLPPRHGLHDIDGDTDFVPGSSPVCFAIVSDFVTITAFDGSELYVENSGEDCLDFSTGAPVFVGSGSSVILGGSGRYAHASGSGTYSRGRRALRAPSR